MSVISVYYGPQVATFTGWRKFVEILNSGLALVLLIAFALIFLIPFFMLRIRKEVIGINEKLSVIIQIIQLYLSKEENRNKDQH